MIQYILCLCFAITLEQELKEEKDQKEAVEERNRQLMVRHRVEMNGLEERVNTLQRGGTEMEMRLREVIYTLKGAQ